MDKIILFKEKAAWWEYTGVIKEKDLKDLLKMQILTNRDRLERDNILKQQKLAYFLDKTLKNENENEYGD